MTLWTLRTGLYLCLICVGVWVTPGSCHEQDEPSLEDFYEDDDSAGVSSKLQALEGFVSRLRRYAGDASDEPNQPPYWMPRADLHSRGDTFSNDDVITSDDLQYRIPAKRAGNYGQRDTTWRDGQRYGSSNIQITTPQRNYVSKRYSPYHYIRGRSCDFTRLTTDHLLEYFRSGKICGRRVSHMRFGLTGRK